MYVYLKIADKQVPFGAKCSLLNEVLDELISGTIFSCHFSSTTFAVPTLFSIHDLQAYNKQAQVAGE